MQQIETQLAKANELVAEGAKAIVELQTEIRRLRSRGKDISDARNLLGHYQALQRRVAVAQGRLRKALAQIVKD